MELAAPASLSGMAIVEPAVLDRKHDGAFIFCVELLRGYLMLLATYAVQVLFLLELHRIDSERERSECEDKTLLIPLVSVFIFEVNVLIDLRRSITLMSLLWAAPAPPRQQAALPAAAVQGGSSRGSFQSVRTCSPKAGAIRTKEEQEPEDGGNVNRMMTRMLKSLRRKTSGKVDRQWIWKLDGISCFFRLWSFLLVALPKFIVGLALGYLGGVYIERSVNHEQMILSTLAVIFIVELDEFLFVAFTSDAMRDNLENMRPVEVDLSNWQRVAMWFTSSVILPVLVAIVTVLIVTHTRTADCPYFTWSLRGLLHEPTFQQLLQ